MNGGEVLVDSNVLLDVLTEDPRWLAWSGDALARAADEAVLAINPIIYAEVSIRFERIEDLEEALAPQLFERRPLPWEAAFLAGKCFLKYRRGGGQRGSPLSDFYIGAQAANDGKRLLNARRVS
jgi:predicted nucleic acid-binding protein